MTRNCVICQQRPHERAQACEACRTRLGHTLANIHTLWTRLPEAFEPGRSKSQRVSGSRETPAPANLDAIDLSARARPGSRAPYVRGLLGLDDDQIGHLSLATGLDAIARDWRDTLCPDHHLPAPTVPELITWLANRAEDACNRHPAIDEAVDELEGFRATLRGILGDFAPRPQLCKGVACKKCDLRALYRGEQWITCGNCGLLYSHDEYHEWTRQLARSVSA